MKTKLIYIILIALAILFAYLWLSTPPKIIYKDSPQKDLDSLKMDISKRDTVIYYSNLKLDSLKLRINELNKEKNMLTLQIQNLKKSYDKQVKFLDNMSIDSAVRYFQSKYDENSGN